MPGIFNIKPSGEKPDEIKTKTTVDFSKGEKVPQLEVIRKLIDKQKKDKIEKV